MQHQINLVHTHPPNSLRNQHHPPPTHSSSLCIFLKDPIRISHSSNVCHMLHASHLFVLITVMIFVEVHYISIKPHGVKSQRNVTRIFTDLKISNPVTMFTVLPVLAIQMLKRWLQIHYNQLFAASFQA
jgi:hypothetical protein